eukprot:36952-Pelagomonas_calceolata.AAC.4
MQQRPESPQSALLLCSTCQAHCSSPPVTWAESSSDEVLSGSEYDEEPPFAQMAGSLCVAFMHHTALVITPGPGHQPRPSPQPGPGP